jgi:hypothetical protein
MGQFDNLHRFARKLGALDAKLKSPKDFFAGKAEIYRSMAASIARATLTAVKPPETSTEDWRKELEALVHSITAELLAPAGLELRIGSAQRQLPNVTSSDGVVYDLDEVRKWVLAGMDRQVGAKILDEDDEAILRKYGEATGSRIIAGRVMRAYYSGNRDANYERLRDAIRKFLGGSNAEQADETLAAVAKAWEQALTPRVKEDLEAWMLATAERGLRG